MAEHIDPQDDHTQDPTDLAASDRATEVPATDPLPDEPSPLDPVAADPEPVVRVSWEELSPSTVDPTDRYSAFRPPPPPLPLEGETMQLFPAKPGEPTQALHRDPVAQEPADPRWPEPWSPSVVPEVPVAPVRFEAEPHRTRRWPSVLLGLLSGAIGAVIAVAAMWGLGVFDADETAVVAQTTPTTVATRVVTEVINPEATGATVAAAVGRKVIPSIVTVEIGSDTAAGFEVVASGSGVVLSADGLIVTNEHVIAGSTGLSFRVVLSDGRVFPYEIVGQDALTDLAVLKVPATDLIAVELGSTDVLSIGDIAIAIGNPLGLSGGPSLTVGVISAFNREVSPGFDASDRLFGMLQTDAPFTNGSSGGALVNGEGRLIGITTAVGVAEAGSGDVGFATPVELMIRITDEIIETGDVRHAFLGITGRDQLNRLDDGSLIPSGAIVLSAEPDTAAEAGGLEPGDVIVRYDDHQVRTMQDLVIGLRNYRVGTPVEFEILRDGAPTIVTIELGERPEGL